MTSTRTNAHPAPATEAPPPPSPAWTVDESKALYNIDGWGAGFFDVNAAGRVIVRPDPAVPERTVDLYELAVDLEAQGVQLPVLFRFSDILRRRIEHLSEGFQAAMKEWEYNRPPPRARRGARRPSSGAWPRPARDHFRSVRACSARTASSISAIVRCRSRSTVTRRT